MPRWHDSDDPFESVRRRVEAAMAREQARIQQAMAFHERASKAAKRRMAAAVEAHERAIAAMRRRLEAATGRSRPSQPPGPIRRRGLEGGEPVPAVPKPRPTPLACGAAAPIDDDRSSAGL